MKYFQVLQAWVINSKNWSLTSFSKFSPRWGKKRMSQHNNYNPRVTPKRNPSYIYFCPLFSSFFSYMRPFCFFASLPIQLPPFFSFPTPCLLLPWPFIAIIWSAWQLVWLAKHGSAWCGVGRAVWQKHDCGLHACWSNGRNVGAAWLLVGLRQQIVRGDCLSMALVWLCKGWAVRLTRMCIRLPGTACWHEVVGAWCRWQEMHGGRKPAAVGMLQEEENHAAGH